jgi:hypothetical protein
MTLACCLFIILLCNVELIIIMVIDTSIEERESIRDNNIEGSFRWSWAGVRWS